MRKRIFSVLLYFIIIIISVTLGFQEHLLLGFMWAGFAGLSCLAGFLMTKWAIKRNPRMHNSFNSDSKEHIIMPILYLVILFSGNFIWLFSHEIGDFMISINSIYLAFIVPFSSIALGEIFAYTRFRTTTNEANNE